MSRNAKNTPTVVDLEAGHDRDGKLLGDVETIAWRTSRRLRFLSIATEELGRSDRTGSLQDALDGIADILSELSEEITQPFEAGRIGEGRARRAIRCGGAK
jgi:hypothetical protein